MTHVDLTNLLTATGGQARGFSSTQVSFAGVGIDSRTIESGHIFWAIRGERHDGHDFVGEAFSRGAAACVIEKTKQTKKCGPAVVVKDVQQALADFAGWHRSQSEAMVVGVTGSFGKTTTREMIHAALTADFSGIRSPHNFNNEIGLPLSLLNIEADHEFAVVEMGASRVGEIQRLSQIALPEVGVVTGIGLAHVEGFGSIEKIIEAKGELLESLPETGFAVLPGDDRLARKLAERAKCPVLFAGEGRENQIRAEEIEVTNEEIRFKQAGDRFAVPATGRHHLQAALLAVAVSREVGMNAAAIAAGLKTFRPVSGRCCLETIGRWQVIDDTYNSNPQSMLAACEVLKNWQGQGRKILVAADMLELGKHSDDCHRELGWAAAEAKVDRLI
ncbi:MAG: UDP-N-acetylmuramoyl-tripeptide--D-alanyl-D-alanine ligase, partial [Planctomycetes bacterium]|nr:UDP-N-acetylmuramoyl-tripeptide--D-alanyl-D-alanine ligase [Planctomycetota bacterium]